MDFAFQLDNDANLDRLLSKSGLRNSRFLKPHQREAVRSILTAWSHPDEVRNGMLLADEMGLGKTLSTIATLLCDRYRHGGHGRALIVVPLSLMQQWKSELVKYAKDSVLFTDDGDIVEDSVVIFHRTCDGTSLETLEKRFVITNYHGVANNASAFAAIKWDWLVADEAHMIRNPETDKFDSMRKLQCANRLALSGTPFQNKCVATAFSIKKPFRPAPGLTLVGSAHIGRRT